jgi:hypothetical protein
MVRNIAVDASRSRRGGPAATLAACQDAAVTFRCALVAVAALAGCGIRAPSRIDVDALVKRHGAVDARRELELRVAHDPHDLAARLAIAAIDDKTGRPSGAIEQLEAVVAIGGPAGTRWHPDDRARLARLLAARGRVRIARGAASGLDDLVRARELGATVEPLELARGKLARAIARLRHVDAGERATGRRLLRELADTPVADPSWRGRILDAGGAERGLFGVWLWAHGARRAAWDELAAWHEAVGAPRDPAIEAAYTAARVWWVPDDAPAAAPDELVGPERCRVDADGCAPDALLAREQPADAELAALLASRPRPTADPKLAAAWLAITLRASLRGELAWARAFTARIDIASLPTASLPAYARPAFARLAGRTEVTDAVSVDGLARHERLVAAAGRALGGASPVDVRAALGPYADTDDGRALLRVVAMPLTAAATSSEAAPSISLHVSFTTAVVEHVSARVPDGLPADTLGKIIEGYLRDPAIGDRLATDAVAESADNAIAHAALGALFDALSDPARARTSWQAAADASAEPAFLSGLAETMARANDPDAALIVGTGAAAASGDPAPVWISLARALAIAERPVQALEAARNAVDLAGPDALAAALDLAIATSRTLGRTEQADGLAARRARLAPALAPPRDGDPTDIATALAAHRAHSSIDTVARLWTASRWNPRDVASRGALLAALGAADPRRTALVDELVALGHDRDPDVGRAAITALRPGR